MFIYTTLHSTLAVESNVSFFILLNDYIVALSHMLPALFVLLNLLRSPEPILIILSLPPSYDSTNGNKLLFVLHRTQNTATRQGKIQALSDTQHAQPLSVIAAVLTTDALADV